MLHNANIYSNSKGGIKCAFLYMLKVSQMLNTFEKTKTKKKKCDFS